MRTISVLFFAFFLAFSAIAQDTPPECLNLEEVRQKIGYPMEAKKAGVAGVVMAKVTVSDNGKVEKKEVIESPSPLLSEAVLAHIDELKFRPAKSAGKPIKSIVQVPIRFELPGQARVYTSLDDALTSTDEVTELDLSGQKLKELDARVSRLRSLRKINLDDNEFTEFPAALKKLPVLEEISISGNMIQVVPGFLRKMDALRFLDISSNEMKPAAIEKAREMLQHVELLTD